MRASTTATVTDNPTVELVDLASGRARNSSPALEGPLSSQVGKRRVNVYARTMAVDSTGTTAYVLTTSGLSIVPLAPQAPQARPQVNSGGVVNEASYLANLAAGSVVSIFGQNLASADSAAAPLPNILGGACVTIDNSAVPVLMTSPGQINVQLPPGLTAAKHSLVVRSLDKKAATAAQSITVAKYAPAVYLDAQTGRAAVYHQDGRPVTKSAPAKRDESLYLMATGLGATTGGKVTAGSASPSDPLAVTAKVQVYFGDPRYKQAEMIVAWSGLVPGLVGVYQINITVPGDHVQGDDCRWRCASAAWTAPIPGRRGRRRGSRGLTSSRVKSVYDGAEGELRDEENRCPIGFPAGLRAVGAAGYGRDHGRGDRRRPGRAFPPPASP